MPIFLRVSCLVVGRTRFRPLLPLEEFLRFFQKRARRRGVAKKWRREAAEEKGRRQHEAIPGYLNRRLSGRVCPRKCKLS